jgi:hypothetical protein
MISGQPPLEKKIKNDEQQAGELGYFSPDRLR